MSELADSATEVRPTGSARAQGPTDFVFALIVGWLLLLTSTDIVGSSIPGQLRTLLHVLGPIAVIMMYALYGWRKGRMRHADTRQRFADNVYFLGFIFTMGALITTFLPVALSNADIRPQDVYYAFGTALLATAFGLIGRVLITQMGATSEEVAARVEEDLTRLAAQVADEAQMIVSDLSRARKDVAKQGEELTRVVLGATAERLDAVADSFQQAADRVSERLGLQATETEAEAAKLRARLQARTTDIVAAAEVMQNARGQLSEAMDGLRLPADQLRNDLSAVSQASLAAVEALRADVSQLSLALRSVGDGSERLVVAVGRAEGEVVTAEQRMQAAAGTIDRISSAGASRIEAGVGKVESGLAAAQAQATALAGDAAGFESQMRSAIAGFEAAVDRFTAELARIGSKPQGNHADAPAVMPWQARPAQPDELQ